MEIYTKTEWEKIYSDTGIKPSDNRESMCSMRERERGGVYFLVCRFIYVFGVHSLSSNKSTLYTFIQW